jgi:hypothetical protein
MWSIAKEQEVNQNKLGGDKKNKMSSLACRQCGQPITFDNKHISQRTGKKTPLESSLSLADGFRFSLVLEDMLAHCKELLEYRNGQLLFVLSSRS